VSLILFCVPYSFDQRTQVRREDGFQIGYDYDPVGQLVAAEGSEPGWQFGYQYDERGNPLRREHSGFVRSNSFNALNQQAESLWSGGAVVLGAVSTTNAIIEINSQPVFAWGLEGMLVFGATNLVVQTGSNEYVAVVSDIFGRSDTNAVTVNVQDQAFAYDLNGNLTNDGVRAYSWDEADRLVEVRDLQTDEIMVQNRYDGLGRRRERIMTSVEAGGGDPGSTNRYVYDGWLVVAVLDGDNDVLEQYVHGVDLSGTREGAGGIGGILQVVGDEVAYYHYDGNGNVTTITDHQGISISRLEYDPFGRVLVADGSYTPRYQFSSKEYDSATGLNYYGYRYYSSQLGRWLSREPLGERESINLYGFVHNTPLNYFDILGLASCAPSWLDHRAPWLGGTPENGFIDNKEWFETHYPNWIAEAEKRFEAGIDSEIQKKCGAQVTYDATVPVLSDAKYGAGSCSESAYGDPPQSSQSADKVLGSFWFVVRDIVVEYSEDGCCEDGGKKLKYTWTATVLIRDALGAQFPDPIWFVGGGIFTPSRNVSRASFSIEGEGECCQPN